MPLVGRARTVAAVRRAADSPVTANPVSLMPATGPDEWTTLVDRDPNATPFHRWTFLQPLARWGGWRFRPLIVRHGGEPVGVLPILSTGRVPYMPALPFPYAGPLVPPALIAPTLAAMRSWQRGAGLLMTRASFSPLQPPAPSSLRRGFRVIAEPTYVLDLAHGDAEQYAAGLNSDRRANLRRAVRRGVTTRPSSPGEAARLLPEVMGPAFARHDGTPSPAVEAIAGFIDEQLTMESPLIAETVLVDGDPVGLMAGVRDGSSAYGWVGGVVRAALSTSASSVAYDAVIRRAIAGGVRRFDFVGHIDEGVAAFKRSFGAREEQCWRVDSSLIPAVVLDARSRVTAFRS